VTSPRHKIAGLAFLAAASATLASGCQSPSSGPNRYQLIGVDSKTDMQTGLRTEVKHWRHEDGRVTDSSKITFNPQGGRSPRGTKSH
jgi:hypothetical protein